jgi:hypothetical protein
MDNRAGCTCTSYINYRPRLQYKALGITAPSVCRAEPVLEAHDAPILDFVCMYVCMYSTRYLYCTIYTQALCTDTITLQLSPQVVTSVLCSHPKTHLRAIPILPHNLPAFDMTW